MNKSFHGLKAAVGRLTIAAKTSLDSVDPSRAAQPAWAWLAIVIAGLAGVLTVALYWRIIDDVIAFCQKATTL